MAHQIQQYEGLVVPQDRETPVQVGKHSGFAWRYAYHRAADTRKANDTGQDFLTFRSNNSTFAFALCDGVGQSFFGDLAARFLGNSLIEWLWANFSDDLSVSRTKALLNTHLASLTGEASQLVREQALPPDIPLMLREVLEQKRAMGSESTFACGRIDLPSEKFPGGRVLLAWMGDSRIRMWGADNERTGELGDTFKTEQRWSTRIGPVKGMPNVFIAPLISGELFTTVQLAVYSDGLALLDPLPRTPSTEDVEGLMQRATQSATSDDISFLEVGVQRGTLPAAEEKAGKTTIAAPSIRSATAQNGVIKASWDPLKGAAHYQIELDNGKQMSWDSFSSVWESPPLEPSNYKMRVRGVGEGKGEWSPATTVVVVSPQPQPQSPPLPAAPVAVSTRGGKNVAPVAVFVGVIAAVAVLALLAFLFLSGGSKSQANSKATPIGALTSGTNIAEATIPQAARRPTDVPTLAPTARAATPTAPPPTVPPTAAALAVPETPVFNPAPAGGGPLKLLLTIQDAGSPVVAVTFSHNADAGTYLAVASADKKVRIYNSALRLVLTRGPAEEGITALAYSPDGALFAAGSDSGSVWLWSAPAPGKTGGDLIRQLPGHTGPITSIAFSPDGKSLASGSTDKDIRVWRIPGGGQLLKQPLVHPDTVRAISFSPDGTNIASVAADGKIRIWSASDGSLVSTVERSVGSPNSLLYSPDGKIIAVASDHTVRVLNSLDGTPLQTYDEHKAPINALAFSPDGRLLASAGSDTLVILWSVQTGKSLDTLSDNNDQVTALSFSPDGRWLASGGSDKKVRLWGTGTEATIAGVLLSATPAPPGSRVPLQTVVVTPRGGETPTTGGEGGEAKQPTPTPTKGQDER